MLPRLRLPLLPEALALLAAIFLLPGLAGHDPWKPQDILTLAIAHGMASGGDLLVPRVAGLRWLVDPPLYHWVAAALGSLLGWLLEFHAAARLASGAFVAAALYFVHTAGRGGSEAGRAPVTAAAAALLLLGSLGLMVHAHEALPELASLAAISGALACLPHVLRRPLQAGAGAGVALGLAFLAAGWIAPVSLAAAVAVALLACREWRNHRGVAFLAVALLVASLLAGAWLAALSARSPEALREWWQLASQPQGELLDNLRRLVGTTGWFAWPAWPLALWSLWSLRRRLKEPRLFVPAVAALAHLWLQSWFGPAQQENLLPILAPLALLAAHGVFTLRRGAVSALDWFSVLTFGFFAALVWLGYVALLTGFPPRIEYNLMRLSPGFEPHFSLLAAAAALALLAGWLYLVFFAAASPVRSVTRWAAGVTLLWASVALLMMPWIDYQKSYRAAAQQLRTHIAAGECVAQRGLGVSQAAALDYHAGIRTRPFDPRNPAACRLVLVQGSPQQERDAPASSANARWTRVAEASRPADKVERFRLYRLK